MAVQRTLIGNIKGPKGDKGDTGDTGSRGAGATVTIGSVTTTAYGGNASVTNSGTETDAVLDFVIPQGAPGETVTDMENLTLSSMTEPSVQFPTPSIGDNGKTLFGKITKWFSDMAALVATKLNTANVVNNMTTTSSGYALDARQGKVLHDAIGQIGTMMSDAGETSVGANTWATGRSLTLSPGTYIIVYQAMSTTGSIRCGWSTSNGCWSASSGAGSMVQFIRILQLTSTGTVSNSLFASAAGTYSNAVIAIMI